MKKIYLLLFVFNTYPSFDPEFPKRFKFTEFFNQFSNHDFSNLQAYVRTTTGMSIEEKAYVNKRLEKNRYFVQKLIGSKLPDEQIPKIAFCCSGGGYRAMIATIGSIIGAQSSGLLDAASYLASLSGSTWAMALWAESGVPAHMLIPYLSSSINKDLFSQILNKDLITTVLLKKYYYNQTTSLVDIYGALLAQTLLKQASMDPQKLVLYNQTKMFKMGTDWVYPIYTSSIVCPKDTEKYSWMEYTPHEIGSEYLGCYIPSWAFGRKFKAGQSMNNAYPESLGSLMGIWGSAFSANIKEIYENFKSGITSPEIKALINKLVSVETIGDKRIAKARVHNFAHKLGSSPMHKPSKLTLVDGGLIANVPVYPLLRPERDIDIIIVFDASSDVQHMAELKKAAEDCKMRGCKFPDLAEYSGTHWCRVFRDQNDPTCPVIIYMPLIKNMAYSSTFDPIQETESGFCSTYNFEYTPQQIKLLSGLTEFNLKMNMPTIIQAIKDTISSKWPNTGFYISKKNKKHKKNHV